MSVDGNLDRLVRSRWSSVLVLVLPLLLYLPSVGNTFAMDDTPIASSKCVSYPELHGDPVITAHLEKTRWEYFSKFFIKHYWWPESYNDGLYRPISVLSYGLIYQAVGRFLGEDGEAIPQHAINVVLNAWAVWLVVVLLVAVGATRAVALLTALLFGLHAIHSEVVAGIVGRAEIFSFCFGAQAMVWMLRGGWWRHLLAGLCLFLAYGSKEVSVCWVPFYYCLVLARTWIREPGAGVFASWWRRESAWALLTLLVPLVAWFALRQVAMQSDPLMATAADFSSNPLAHESAPVRILTAIKVWGYGLWLCLVPAKLSCLYSPHVFAIVRSPLDPGFLAAIAGLGGWLVVGLWWARRQPLLFLGMACFLGFAFVTSNVPLAIGTIFGERLYYTPSLGVCLAVALGVVRLGGRPRRIALVVLAAWCVGSVVVASIRVGDWYSSRTVFLTDVEKYPMAIDLHRKVAQTHSAAGPLQDYDKAIEHYQRAIELLPNYAHAHRGLGDIYKARQQWAQAIAAYQQSYGHGYPDPAGAESIAFNAIGDCHLGMADAVESDAEKRQLIGQARSWYEKSLQVPRFGDSWGEASNRIGSCFIHRSTLEQTDSGKEREVRQALEYFQRTITMRPIDKPSRLEAFEKVFLHAFTPRPLLPPQRIHELYLEAYQVVGEDPELTLLMGAAAYKANLPAIMVLQPLHAAITTFPADKKDAAYYTTNLFYAEALLEVGQPVQARQVYEMLLGRPELDAMTKAKIRKQLREDPRLQR